jgi:tetratricopeptide (TPR) repeat protein
MPFIRPALLLLGTCLAWAALQTVPLLGAAALAQPETATLLEQSRAAAAQARSAYTIHTPDQPLWAEALRLARQAKRLAPGDLEVSRHLALTYSEVRWYSRALDSWLEYLEAGGELEPGEGEAGPHPRDAFAEAGNQLGFARYSAGNIAAAVGFYQTVLRQVPSSAEALYWLGRINLELGEVEAASGYFDRLLAEDPEHRTASYFLTLISERERVGAAASDAYREGLSAYEEERLPQAHDAFARALAANPAFADAAVWAGRTALELGRPSTAVRFWEQATRLRPDDGGADYFLEVARTQALWGVEAGRAFFAGQAAYELGDLATAAEEFVTALEANPAMVDAWVWAARSRQEMGEPAEAHYYWQGALERRPDDERARYFMELARQQMEYGPDAGQAFMEAVRHYQLAEFEQAEAGFQTAVAENPGFAAAWAWLGRLYFTRADYHSAAEAYGRAAELRPDNEDYAFFAEESARLAGEGS